ncbi:MAG: Unknown protein [uncultured Sulfurovum sp.]|uniref:Uncharacterized protein n=1 Tax=uncultured Sulfurovum sp. TaxID=269237 RepID=A0A6S6TPS9_9BACT|nr:MAG: Unknown protein [uncultured Sulfurovum sp.]
MPFMRREITEKEIAKYNLDGLWSKYKSQFQKEFNIKHQGLYDKITDVWFFSIGVRYMLADKYSKVEIELNETSTFFDPDMKKFTTFYKCKSLGTRENKKLLEESMNIWVNSNKSMTDICYCVSIKFSLQSTVNKN